MRERAVAFAVLVFGLMAAPAYALDPHAFGGHLGLGYSHLVIADSPGGSLSVAAGVDYPIAPSLRLGGDIGFELLGSRTIEAEGQIANLDYNAFEAALLFHYTPGGWGPISRVSFGPALVSARAELATSGGGLAFTGYAIEEVAPAAALDLTWIGSGASPVRAGVQLGTRTAFLESDTWTIVSLRLAIHY